MEFRSEHRKAMLQQGKHRNAMLEHGIGTGTRSGTGTGTGTKLEMVILRMVWWYPSLSMELNSGNLGSQCEAVIAVIQGLMSSKVELVLRGCDRGVTGSELAEVLSSKVMWVVMECNTTLGTIFDMFNIKLWLLFSLSTDLWSLLTSIWLPQSKSWIYWTIPLYHKFHPFEILLACFTLKLYAHFYSSYAQFRLSSKLVDNNSKILDPQ